MADEEIVVPTAETPTEESTVEETKVEEPEVKESSKVEPPSEDAKAALNLFNALKDPESSGVVLKQLAELAGLDLVKKKDQKELKKTISQIVTEELGEDNSILAEKLGPALEKIITEAVEERIKPVKDTIEEGQKQEFASRIDSTFKKLETDTKGLSKKLETEMVKLMDQVQPGPKTQPEDYIQYIYKLAKSNFDEAEAIKTQNAKRDQNKKVPSVPSGTVNPDRVKSGSKFPTIRESVQAAIRGETLE